jgi:hypothetical protein
VQTVARLEPQIAGMDDAKIREFESRLEAELSKYPQPVRQETIPLHLSATFKADAAVPFPDIVSLEREAQFSPELKRRVRRHPPH